MYNNIYISTDRCVSASVVAYHQPHSMSGVLDELTVYMEMRKSDVKEERNGVVGVCSLRLYGLFQKCSAIGEIVSNDRVVVRQLW